MNRIEGVVFDVDGTIIDTFEHIVRAFEVVLPEYGALADREAIAAVIGRTLRQCYEVLHPSGDHDVMAARHHEVQQAPNMYDLITIYDGFTDVLDTLADASIKSAVLTNRSRISLDLIFSHLGIQDKFDVVVTPQDVTTPKPDPEGLLLVSKKLKLPPASLAIVGDTEIDILAGKKAGVAMTVGVTHGFGSRKSITAAGADKIIDHFDDLPLALGVA